MWECIHGNSSRWQILQTAGWSIEGQAPAGSCSLRGVYIRGLDVDSPENPLDTQCPKDSMQIQKGNVCMERWVSLALSLNWEC